MSKKKTSEPDTAGEIEIDISEAAGELPDAAADAELPPPAVEADERLVLVYEGEVPLANFLIRTPEGFYDYVHVRRGEPTEPLPRVVAEQLLASNKRFRIADPASD